MTAIQLHRGRALTRPAKNFLDRSVRSLSCSALQCGATSIPPGGLGPSGPGGASTSVEHPTYLGYLSNVFSGLLPKTNPFSSLYNEPTKESPTTATKSETLAKIIANDRTIVRKTSRSEVTTRTKALVKKLLHAESRSSKMMRLQELSHHIMMYPPTRVVAVQDGSLIANLLNIARKADDEDMRAEAFQCLSLCGYIPPVKSRGINLLTIDGGGTRGLIGLEVLEALEKVTGKKICQLFDHIVGVSTGGILACLLGANKMTTAEARAVYMEISRKVFGQDLWSGVSGLLWSHSYYDTKRWISLLKEILGEHTTMISTARDPTTPKLSIVSCIVNLPHLQPFVFRNYELPAGRDSHYRGASSSKVWQAVQASAAAPGYFEEVQIGDVLHQDGGVFANNPTAIAVHETRLLWPDEHINCLVSVGNGRTVQELEPTPDKQSTRLKEKLNKIIDSATDTEAVHVSMHDLLSEAVYHRLNPYMMAPYGLDEIHPEKLALMQTDAKLYVRRNIGKIEHAAERLLQTPTLAQFARRCVDDWKCRNGYYRPN